MDFPITASTTHPGTGNPLLIMPDQDHPNTMNQIAWSLMYILAQRGIAGAAFDPDVESTYSKLYLAIADMIAGSATALASILEHQQGTVTTKAATPAGVAAGAGNYSKYVSITTASVALNAADMGALIIASASANAITLPLLSAMARVGAAFTVLNLKASGNVTISRAGGDALSGVFGSTTAVVLSPGQSITLVKLSAGVWAVIGSSMNDTQNTQVGIGAVIWYPSRAVIPTGWVAGDGQIGMRGVYPGITALLGSLPTVTDSDWIGTPANRASYSQGDGVTSFRFPDYNGKYGPDISLFLRGDGGNAAAEGQIQPSDNKAHIHNIGSAYHVESGVAIAVPSNVPGAGITTSSGGSEARPENVAGVWCIRAS